MIAATVSHTRENARRARQVARRAEVDFYRAFRLERGLPRKDPPAKTPPMISGGHHLLDPQDLLDAEHAAEQTLAVAGRSGASTPSSMSQIAVAMETPAYVDSLALGSAAYCCNPGDLARRVIYVDPAIHKLNPKYERYLVAEMVAFAYWRRIRGLEITRDPTMGWCAAFALALTMPRSVVQAVYNKYGEVTGPELARLCRVPDRLGLIRKRMIATIDAHAGVTRTIDLDLEPVAAEE